VIRWLPNADSSVVWAVELPAAPKILAPEPHAVVAGDDLTLSWEPAAPSRTDEMKIRVGGSCERGAGDARVVTAVLDEYLLGADIGKAIYPISRLGSPLAPGERCDLCVGLARVKHGANEDPKQRDFGRIDAEVFRQVDVTVVSAPALP